MIELINGKPTRMLGDTVVTANKVMKKYEEGKDYFIYAAWVMGDYGDFEVFTKMYRPKSKYDKNEGYTQIQHYPSTSEWGKFAWSYRNINNARKFIEKRFKT